MIHNIIHISDIHIRTGDSKKSRYDEYIQVFNNLYDSLHEQPSIINKSAVIVITGDIFHDKNKIGPSGIKIATYLLQKLSSLAHVIVIRGNHDYRQDHPTEHDMISALVSYDIPNVTYLDTTGIHTFKNISFGLTAIQETLLYGSTSGIAADLPPFPTPSSTSNYKVALFHGTINGCLMQNGLVTTRNGYPIDWFQEYDAILLGDIHLQQIKRATITENPVCKLPHTSICQTYSYSSEIPWGYAGSLLQQDFGEPVKGHGYVLWNLQDKQISVYHVKNKYGMVKIHYNGNIDELMVEHKQYIKPITKVGAIEKIIPMKWFPDLLHVRVFGENITQSVIDTISNKITSYGKTILTITKKETSKIIANEKDTTKGCAGVGEDVQNINSIESLVTFIQDKLTSNSKNLSSQKWKQWLLHPETIKFTSSHIPDSITSKLAKKVENIDKSIVEFRSEFEKLQSLQRITGTLTLNKLEWNWILNYKNNNVFDFDKNKGCISVINAKNGNGKSNFLEIICIALFGEGFASRHNTNYSSNIICNKKPDGIMASTHITFTLNNISYTLKRVIRNAGTKRSIDFEAVILSRIGDNSENTVIHQGKSAVTAWVAANIGLSSSYLMSTMLTQNADSDFFSLDHSTQKELLDNVLSLTHINSLKKLLKDSTIYYKTCIELLEAYTDGITAKQATVDQKFVDELDLVRGELGRVTSLKNDLFTKWNTVAQSELNKYTGKSGRVALESTLSSLCAKIESLPTETVANIKSKISDATDMIRFYTSELANFHLFSDLDSDSDLDLDLDLDSELRSDLELKSNNFKSLISQSLIYLQQHPFFKDKLYSLYENYNTVCDKCDELQKFTNEDDNSDLLKIIHEFKIWKNLQTEKFQGCDKYFRNKSEIEKLQISIKNLTLEISDLPDRVAKITKDIDKLRKQLKILHKEKEAAMDRRPNKPTKDEKWLREVEADILKYGTLEDYQATHEFISNSIRNVPLVLNKISDCAKRITEYEQYISDCADCPFNADCSACRVQPWRLTYESYMTDLPRLKAQKISLDDELDSLKYDECGTDVTKLNKALLEISKQITDIQVYEAEKGLIADWGKWSASYNELRQNVDTLDTEIAGLEKDKRAIESRCERARGEKQRLQLQLENVLSKKHEYEQYMAELDGREKEAAMASSKLAANWYSELKTYRRNITQYLDLLRGVVGIKREEVAELERRLVVALERESLCCEMTELKTVVVAYPFWTEWVDVGETEDGLRKRLGELEFMVGGGVGGSGCGGRGGAAVTEFAADLKQDYTDLLWIAETFEGYHEWLYTGLIGPIIKRRVNTILDMMCGDDRPLALECEWLDLKNGVLSWFIRDCGGTVIIQKASGFQRFIVGIAMRVAINQIGLSKMRFTEFFIDEGFTACDVDNLERVPDFLRGLLGHYRAIYLATHLEDLKLCADRHIFIRREDAAGLSQIQYGDVEVVRAVEEAGSKGGRKGRPTKTSVTVTVKKV